MQVYFTMQKMGGGGGGGMQNKYDEDRKSPIHGTAGFYNPPAVPTAPDDEDE